MKKTWERRLEEAKKKHRPKLKDWSKDAFATRRTTDFEELSSAPSSCFIDRISCRSLSTQDFVERYERPCLPVIISDIPQEECWEGGKPGCWDSFAWLKDKVGERLFKVGEDDDGYKVKVKLRYFLRYLAQNTDDSPLYVFDSGSFEEDKVLMGTYAVPSYFPDDLFSLVGEKRRPPYKWFLLGPKRSGTCVHIDPLGTSAWNTVIRGRKRWVLFPPGTSKSVAKALDHIKKGEDDEAINYFVDFLPRLRQEMKRQQQQKHAESSSSSSSSSDEIPQMIEFTQYPGETVFVPGGWWHAVLNLDDSVAVTQNFCSSTNFLKVWKHTRSGRKKMACKWLRKLKTSHPALARQAEEANRADAFTMWSDLTEEEKRSKKKKKKEEEKKKVPGATAQPTSTVVPATIAKASTDASSSHSATSTSNSNERPSSKHDSHAKVARKEKKRKLAGQETAESAASSHIFEANIVSCNEEPKKKKKKKEATN